MEQLPKIYLYRRIVQAKLFIDGHFGDDIDLDNIADEAYFSKFHFIRLFKTIYNRTPHQYLTIVRIENAKQFLTSVKNACVESQMILIGGETAEMPGVYHENDFDCAGFSVGVVDQEKTWGADKVSDGDMIIGLASSGFHSNGYSLLRKIFENEFDQYREWLMKPTRLYVEAAVELNKKFQIKAGETTVIKL